MLVQAFISLFAFVNSEFPSMHGLPCASLGHCFGHPSDVNTDPAPAQDSNYSKQNRNESRLAAADPVTSQPDAAPCSAQQQQRYKHPQKNVNYITDHSTRTLKVTNSQHSVCHRQEVDEDPSFESPPACHSPSQSSEVDEEGESRPETELKCPQIPRPSIIIRPCKVRWW